MGLVIFIGVILIILMIFTPSWVQKEKERREKIAAQVMTGLVVAAIPGSHNTIEQQIKELPEKAIRLADALIAELDKERLK